jgi:hypothetical protein
MKRKAGLAGRFGKNGLLNQLKQEHKRRSECTLV